MKKVLQSLASIRVCSRFLLSCLLVGFVFAPATVLYAQELTAGAARFDITPDLALSNWITHKPYGEMLEPVFVRAIVLGQGEKRVACVSWELLYPMEGAVAKVRKAIAAQTGIPESDIMVTATHNHSAPWSPIFGDPLTLAERKVLQSFLSDANYPAWADKVVNLTVKAVKQADDSRRPARLSIARAYVGDVMFNRRPIRPNGSVETMTTSSDPFVMPHALRYGRTDPTMTVLFLRDAKNQTIASLFQMACHGVVVYPAYDGLSADWPGAVCAALQKELGGEAIFLQGCAGDTNPLQRGKAARDQIATVVSARAIKASKVSEPLVTTNGFSIRHTVVKAPVKEEIRAEMGREYLPAEVQVLTCGDLAIVALPGEPLIALALAIQERSPFPHTIVLGYSNGYGVQYVGMPGDQGRGGYEMGDRCLGTDACGQMLVDAAVQLLQDKRQ